MNDYPRVDLTTDALLTTTRSVRRRLDWTKPVPTDLIRECLEIAVQAPTSSNLQNWSFIVVTDAEQRTAIGQVYRRTWDWLASSPFAVAHRLTDDPARKRVQRRVSDSVAYLAQHFGEVPVLSFHRADRLPLDEVVHFDRWCAGDRDSRRRFVHMLDPIRAVRVALRLSLAAAFLSAVADRFGVWESLGQGNWGSMGRFADYTHELVPFASGWSLTVIVWAATVTESTLGMLLLAGWWPQLVGGATCLVLIMFGTAMAVSHGIEEPLSYSVFSASSAAAAYAVLGTVPRPGSAEATDRRRSPRSPG